MCNQMRKCRMTLNRYQEGIWNWPNVLAKTRVRLAGILSELELGKTLIKISYVAVLITAYWLL
jgi:hypothetical protein